MSFVKNSIHAVLTGILAASVLAGEILWAAPDDWTEGAKDKASGATRDYYNRAASLIWKNRMGDWRDADNVAQGDKPYSVTTLIDDDTSKYVEWDVTKPVQEWMAGVYPNKGLLLRAVSLKGTHKFRSREYSDASQRPLLIITTEQGEVNISPEADTYLDSSTYRSLGNMEELAVSGSLNMLLRFDLSDLAPNTIIKSAVLRMYTFAPQYSKADIGVFRADSGEVDNVDSSEQHFGLASQYKHDRNIIKDPDVIFFADFESSDWKDEWSEVHGYLDIVAKDPARKFEQFQGKALRVKLPKGHTTAMNTSYYFAKEDGKEPEEIYFRYYLRLGNDWNQTV